ncbi:MAG: hypothetical protein ACKOXC_01185 [Aquirufa sp.]
MRKFQFIDMRIYFRYKSLNLILCNSLKMQRVRILLLGVFSFLLGSSLYAQEFYPSQRTWDKTRIQYQKFSWKYLSNQNFEVYYFGKNETLARTTLQILDADFQRMTNLLSYTPFQKTRVFVYPSGSELIQSNSGISYADAQEAAEENRAKFRIEIAYQNDYQSYRNQLLRQLSHVYIHDILYGGSIKDALQNSILLSVPEWFTSGLAAYVANGETAAMSQYMYQVVVANKVRKPVLARGLEAEYLGQSIWSYLAKTYGANQIGNIVNLTRVIRNEQSSISSTIRKPIAKFLKEWFEFYVSEAKQYDVNVKEVEKKSLMAVEIGRGEQLRGFQLSPDGKWMVYILEDAGRYRIMLKSLVAASAKEIFRTGLKDPLRADGGQSPIVRWSNKLDLYVLYAQEGKNFLNTYQWTRQSLRFNSKKNLGDVRFLDFELNNSQNLLVRTLKQGQVDVGIYDLRRNRLTPITQDQNQESEAHWWGSNGDVVYLTDRITDSTYMKEKGMLAFMHWRADAPSEPKTLFIHKGLISNIRPVSDSLIYFLNESNTAQELVSYHTQDQKLYQTIVKSGNWSDFQWLNESFLVKNRDILSEQLQLFDSKQLMATPSYLWYPLLPDTTQVAQVINPTDENKRSSEIRRSRIERQQALRLRKDSNRLQGPLDYQNSFVINGSEGNFRIDPIRGLGYSMELKMNDLMENHLLKVGGYLSANIKNIDLWGEYAYLANKVDWIFRVDRRVLDQETETVSQKIRFNRAELKGIYPLNLQSKLSFSGMLTTNRAFDQYNVSTPEIVSTYLGGRLNYTFDNSVYWTENLRTGFRMFAGAEYQYALNQQSFTRFNLDARHYFKISNSLLLATRLSASHAVGIGAPQTLLGGMDNWLFIDREARTKENPLGTNGIAQPNVFMSDFATTLRGFRMNKLSGNSHLLANIELRIPLKSLIGSAYSKSQFMNTFQMVGFFDAGSAWTGANPFARSNGFNTNVYGGNTNPFRATVTDFRNPFLFGYGFGARANIVGYFIKLDYAYGIENDEVKSPMTYLSLGHDF